MTHITKFKVIENRKIINLAFFMLKEKDRAIGKVLISWFRSFEHFSV